MEPTISRLVRADLIDTWFFVRYSDMSPHIRIRALPNSSTRVETLSATLQESLKAESSLLSTPLKLERIVETPYAPELERYGGASAMPCVESMFALSTKIVTRSLRDVLISTDPKEKYLQAAELFLLQL